MRNNQDFRYGSDLHPKVLRLDLDSCSESWIVVFISYNKEWFESWYVNYTLLLLHMFYYKKMHLILASDGLWVINGS